MNQLLGNRHRFIRLELDTPTEQCSKRDSMHGDVVPGSSRTVRTNDVLEIDAFCEMRATIWPPHSLTRFTVRYCKNEE
jgi:hypothetical protein